MIDHDAEGIDATPAAMRKQREELEQHKTRVLEALKRGYDRGARSPEIPRPAIFDPEAAWAAVLSEVPNIRIAKRNPDRVHSGKRGRPSGRTAQDPVALLAPIYRRFAGAKPTASHAHVVKGRVVSKISEGRALAGYQGAAFLARHAAVAPVANKRSPRSQKKPHTGGPFVAFVQSVTEACGLRLGASSIDKMFAILEANADRDDRLAEAQCRFASSYRTAAEIFAHLKLD